MRHHSPALIALLVVINPALGFGQQDRAGEKAYFPDDVVAVVRWIDRPALDGFVKRLLAAVSKS